MDGTTSYFTKDNDLYYTTICVQAGKIFTPVSWDDFHPDLKLRDSEACQILAPHITREDELIQKTQCTTRGFGLLRSFEETWVIIQVKKSPYLKGVHGELTTVYADTLFNGWPDKLCKASETLKVLYGTLTRRDLTMIHMLLKGKPRKSMARDFGISIKTVEKRLTQFKDILAPTAEPHYLTVQECLIMQGLHHFLLAKADWFDLTPKYNFIISK